MTDLVIALSGGIGGAKLALGLDRVLSPRELILVANTGDDFDHVGFHICPDIDTLIYTLAGVSNTELSWGRAEETWAFMEELREQDPEPRTRFSVPSVSSTSRKVFAIRLAMCCRAVSRK